jgi:Dolichyl-phosphate-mannose-protein mannosyltransferase
MQAQAAPDGAESTIANVSILKLMVVFLISCCVIFLCMTRRINLYDEGLMLTAAVRVGHGQIPHRDFYALYGPAQFYILAGLFKLFGTSALTERIYDVLIKGLTITSVYGIVALYCRRSIAVVASIATTFWIIAMNESAGAAMIPSALLNLVSSFLVLRAILHKPSTRRMFFAGVLAGLATLVRYDTGIALFGMHALLIALGAHLRGQSTKDKLLAFVGAFWPYLAGFSIVTLPVLAYFLSVSSLQPVLHDVVLFPGKYYNRTRGLPFPGIGLRHLENLGIYLPIVIAILSFFIALPDLFRSKVTRANDRPSPRRLEWEAVLVCFGVLTLVLCLKGLVRVSVGQMYLALIPSLILLAVLYQHRRQLSINLNRLVYCLAVLSLLAPTWAFLHEVSGLRNSHLYVPQTTYWSSSHASTLESAWCKTENPLTKGMCFIPEGPRIEAIEYLRAHTTRGQMLLSANSRNDKVFANDNVTYFATELLPSTHWGEFDPHLQNDPAIQAEMIQELKTNRPRYVLLDSEFENIIEPNESALSTGATALDVYLRSHYRPAATFDFLSVWQEIDAPVPSGEQP